jgi:hypothetical protein
VLDVLILITLPRDVVGVDALSGDIGAEGLDCGGHDGYQCRCHAVGTGPV